MELRNLLRDTKLSVHILVCLFGIASWVDINGLWVELPLMVTKLPESWNLPSYMIIIIQVANIGPLVFGFLSYMYKNKKPEIATSVMIIIVGFIACMLLAFLWQETSIVAGERHSTALLCLNFFLATVDCTSSMAFLAFMSSLKSQYLSSFFIGEGLSGMIPSLTALAQGAGHITCINVSNTNSTLVNDTLVNETTYFIYPQYEDPRFSVQVFFFILSGMMLVSLSSFLVLLLSPSLKTEYSKNSSTLTDHETKSASIVTITKFEVRKEEKKFHAESGELVNASLNDNPSNKSLVTLLLVVAWINFLVSSFLLALQTYSVLPYGIENYHLTVTLTNIANPLACFLSMFVTLYSVAGIVIVTVVGTLCGAYITAGAALSPSPFLVSSDAGGPLMVACWVLCVFLLTYAKVGVANVLRQDGRRSLILCGAFTQIGSFSGAIVGYILVNIYHLFTDAPYC